MSGAEQVNTEMLTTLMRSPTMRSNYLCLNPPQKINFLCGPIEICIGEDCFDTVASLLAESPYAAVFLCEMAVPDYFQDIQMNPALCK